MAKKKQTKRPTPSLSDLPTQQRVPYAIRGLPDADLRQRITDAWHANRFILRAILVWRSWCDSAHHSKTADPRLPIQLRFGILRSLGSLCSLGALPREIRNSSADELMDRFPGALPGDVSTERWKVDAEYISNCIKRLNSETIISLEDQFFLFESHLVESPSVAIGWRADEQSKTTQEVNIEWTRPMSKKDAAKYLDYRRAKKTQWINKCVADGTLKIKTLTRTMHRFNLDAFLPEVRDKLKPNPPD